MSDIDPTASSRKKDHIELAFKSQVTAAFLDKRFYYEPMLAAHPDEEQQLGLSFLGFEFRVPMWVSSMTGGTGAARTINQNLARACGEFGFGMGLGSCRGLLYSDEYLKDFDVKYLIGKDLPLLANLGIAQIETLYEAGQEHKIIELLEKLSADGLIIHVNPFQEWLQPEGDRFKYPPLYTIQRVLELISKPVVVKEVGQGMGPESLRALLELPLAAIDFAAAGGTNFALLELLRSDSFASEQWHPLTQIGHSSSQMVEFLQKIMADKTLQLRCKGFIASGGIQSFLDGYHALSKLPLPSVYGQASAFLKYARQDYESLQKFIALQIKGLKIAKAFLRVQ
ncbi:MAG: type 2 isopentenyl-diphosphate Delta-isomerase [Cytophagales bacterium]|nr:MAG: type 2 isopentenyl-diphosphate Delta-isomerase [Cytophagales bacterium]TAF60596.1 MAG: type 2 isopentenyl-diphosphate Delta-isomerase [Cytophagales bacterium]